MCVRTNNKQRVTEKCVLANVCLVTHNWQLTTNEYGKP